MNNEHGSEPATERTPFLGVEDASPGRRSSSESLSSSLPIPKLQGSPRIVNLLCVIVFLAACSDGFSSIPLTQLIEDAVCRDRFDIDAHTPSSSLDPELCKDQTVQSRVALVFAVSGTLDALVGFFAALPWGTVADRIGRKPVASLALLGGTLTNIWWIVVLSLSHILPLWAGWFASAALLIGGGYSLLLATIHSIIADVSSDDTRYVQVYMLTNRAPVDIATHSAVYFMRLHVSAMVGMLTSPALSSTMMSLTGPWVVLWFGVGCVLISCLAFLFIPETVRNPVAVIHQSGIKAHLSQAFRTFRDTLSILESPPLTMLLVVSFLTQPVLLSTLQFLVQFISKRYSIELKYTGYIQTAYGVVQVFQAFVGLPFISRQLMAPRGSTHPWSQMFHMETERERDHLLTRWSFIILVPALLTLGIAPSLGVFMLGLLVLGIAAGFASYNRSLMTLYVDKELQTRLYSLAAMVDVAATIYAGPMLATLFSKGMDLGGVGIGLPYFVLAALTTVSLVPLLLVRLPKAETPAMLAEE